MYKEEMVVNNILYYRNSTEDTWKQYTLEEVVIKYSRIKQKIEDLLR